MEADDEVDIAEEVDELIAVEVLIDEETEDEDADVVMVLVVVDFETDNA